jgi:hypothetical protein
MITQAFLDFFRDILVMLIAPLFNMTSGINTTVIFDGLTQSIGSVKAILAMILPSGGAAGPAWTALLVMVNVTALLMIAGPIVKAILRRIP